MHRFGVHSDLNLQIVLLLMIFLVNNGRARPETAHSKEEKILKSQSTEKGFLFLKEPLVDTRQEYFADERPLKLNGGSSTSRMLCLLLLGKPMEGERCPSGGTKGGEAGNLCQEPFCRPRLRDTSLTLERILKIKRTEPVPNTKGQDLTFYSGW